jgi:cytidine deaminase
VTDAELIAAALAARAHAYAPYSNYHVGSAIQAGGHLFTGANVENASYGLALCAERNAVAAAVLAGHRRLDAVAVVTQSSPPAPPCGMCLQTLAEFAPDFSALRVILTNPAGDRRDFTLADLLPHGFVPKDLGT